MKLGRICGTSFGRTIPRLVAVVPEEHLVLDLERAEYVRLRAQGATDQSASRIASALFPSSMSEAIGGGPTFLEAVQRCLGYRPEEALLDVHTVTWLPPLDPPVMRDCLAFEQHLRNAFEKGQKRPVPPVFYEQPVYYKGNPSTLIGHEEEVCWPHYTHYLDYELELGFVVGRSGCNLRPEDALPHLFGITILNDFSARDMQRKEGAGGLGPAKGKDFATGLGPWITTHDELDLTHLDMIARVNGEEWSRGSSAMMWSVEEILAYVSIGEGIHPGELIGSGTVGFGCGLELGKKLQPGDVVELEVPGIGILRNRIGQPPKEPGWMPSRRTPFSS